jgi:hypothetical protein
MLCAADSDCDRNPAGAAVYHPIRSQRSQSQTHYVGFATIATAAGRVSGVAALVANLSFATIATEAHASPPRRSAFGSSQQ